MLSLRAAVARVTSSAPSHLRVDQPPLAVFFIWAGTARQGFDVLIAVPLHPVKEIIPRITRSTASHDAVMLSSMLSEAKCLNAPMLPLIEQKWLR